VYWVPLLLELETLLVIACGELIQLPTSAYTP
jgi:hypothetical protein